jgi:hypothetical protein
VFGVGWLWLLLELLELLELCASTETAAQAPRAATAAKEAINLTLRDIIHSLQDPPDGGQCPHQRLFSGDRSFHSFDAGRIQSFL